MYNVIAADQRYYVTDGVTVDMVWRNVPLEFALPEAERISKANFYGTAWVEDQNRNRIEKDAVIPFVCGGHCAACYEKDICKYCK